MNDTLHGPWKIGQYEQCLGQPVSCTIDGATFPVCFVQTPLQGGVARHDLREAFARSIVAAPAMLAALEAVHDAYGWDETGLHDEPVNPIRPLTAQEMNAVRDAILLARGEDHKAFVRRGV